MSEVPGRTLSQKILLGDRLCHNGLFWVLFNDHPTLFVSFIQTKKRSFQDRLLPLPVRLPRLLPLVRRVPHALNHLNGVQLRLVQRVARNKRGKKNRRERKEPLKYDERITTFISKWSARKSAPAKVIINIEVCFPFFPPANLDKCTIRHPSLNPRNKD